MSTGFYWDERCFWHGSAGGYAGTAPVGGFVQPLGAEGLPDGPEGKRRLKNLLEVSGLIRALEVSGPRAIDRGDLARVHDAAYLDRFAELSRAGGGELGLRAPFGPGGYEIACVSAGLAVAAVEDVLRGRVRTAYALSRPPGHHCTADTPQGFCLLNNIAVAIARARANGLAERVAVLDWDVHHGNGTEAIFYDDPDILTVSLHQAFNYPMDSGRASDRGGPGAEGSNLNVPLPSGCGHVLWLEALDRLALPALQRHRPDLIVVACGFDAGLTDPLGRMLCTAETFRTMAER